MWALQPCIAWEAVMELYYSGPCIYIQRRTLAWSLSDPYFFVNKTQEILLRRTGSLLPFQPTEVYVKAGGSLLEKARHSLQGLQAVGVPIIGKSGIRAGC